MHESMFPVVSAVFAFLLVIIHWLDYCRADRQMRAFLTANVDPDIPILYVELWGLVALFMGWVLLFFAWIAAGSVYRHPGWGYFSLLIILATAAGTYFLLMRGIARDWRSIERHRRDLLNLTRGIIMIGTVSSFRRQGETLIVTIEDAEGRQADLVSVPMLTFLKQEDIGVTRLKVWIEQVAGCPYNTPILVTELTEKQRQDSDAPSGGLTTAGC